MRDGYRWVLGFLILATGDLVKNDGLFPICIAGSEEGITRYDVLSSLDCAVTSSLILPGAVSQLQRILKCRVLANTYWPSLKLVQETGEGWRFDFDSVLPLRLIVSSRNIVLTPIHILFGQAKGLAP